MAMEDTAESTMNRAKEQARGVADKGRQAAEAAAEKVTDAIKNGYQAAHQFAEDRRLFEVEGMRDFVRNEPWLALGAAFAIGYVAARIMRRAS